MRYALLLSPCALVLAVGRRRAHNPDKQSFEVIEHGRYMATAADCTACHTANGRQPFAGGGALETPFGTLLAPNITPDVATGIGGWTDDEFVDAVRNGIGHGGIHLYPAMPYTYYTKMTRADVIAIRAYLDTVQPVRNVVHREPIAVPVQSARVDGGLERALFQAGRVQARPQQVGGMEPRRLSGRRRRALRLVPHAEERDGRRRERPSNAGLGAAELVRAEPNRQPPRWHRRLDRRRHRALPEDRTQPLRHCLRTDGGCGHSLHFASDRRRSARDRRLSEGPAARWRRAAAADLCAGSHDAAGQA